MRYRSSAALERAQIANKKRQETARHERERRLSSSGAAGAGVEMFEHGAAGANAPTLWSQPATATTPRADGGGGAARADARRPSGGGGGMAAPRLRDTPGRSVRQWSVRTHAPLARASWRAAVLLTCCCRAAAVLLTCC
jgi:hypothetical protein